MSATALMAAGTTVAVIGTILGGIGAKQQADLSAFNIETENIQNKTLAKQQAQARREEYDSATQTNLAMFAAMGRDIGSDRSVQAFLDRQEAIVARDVGRIQDQAQMQNLRSIQMAAAERKRGQNALVSSLFSAAGQAGTGIYQYKAVQK